MNERFNQNVNKQRFRKFDVQTYRRILRAWMTSESMSGTSLDSGLESTSGDNYCQQLNDSLESIDIEINETLRETDKTIESEDSLDSIPETPEFVEKPKEPKRERNNRKLNKRLVSEFIDFEAEVAMDSKEAFFDDIENTQKESESSSQTIINDMIPMDTQPIGQLIGGIDSRRAKDMQTVYLRSVKDQMIGNSDKYKLQYNYDPTIEVYSQEPNESDLEDYQMDSFCVPNDSIEFDESSPQTAPILIEIGSPSQPIPRGNRKKFKRIIFSP